MPHNRIEALTLWALTIASALLAQPSQLCAQQTLAITHVTVIDGTGREPEEDMTVVTANGRIAALGKSGRIKLSKGVQVVPANGRFLIPGLWNMHLHAGNYEEGRKALGRLLAYGITGVRDMGAPLDDVLRLRQETGEARLVGPRLVVAGPLLQGPISLHLPLLLPLWDEGEARDTVDMLKQRGVNFVKVGDTVPRALYFAISDQAKRRNLPVAGHLPPTVRVAEAAEAGQASIEHLGGRFFGVLVGCSRREDELRRKLISIYDEALAALERNEKPAAPQFHAAFARTLLESYDPERAAALFTGFSHHRTWQCPTLVALRTLWEDNEEDLDEEDTRYGAKVFAKDLEVVSAMQRADVRFLAGTDGPYGQGGQSLHAELALLVEAGFTPMEALQAATRNPAEFLGKLDSLGTVEQGKIADLVLLEANPLQDIHNIGKVAAVVLGGRLITASEIKRLRGQSEKSGQEE